MKLSQAQPAKCEVTRVVDSGGAVARNKTREERMVHLVDDKIFLRMEGIPRYLYFWRPVTSGMVKHASLTEDP